MRGRLLVLALVFLVVPSAVAQPLQGLPWRLEPGQASPLPNLLSANATDTVLFFAAFADADGDGRDDLLEIEERRLGTEEEPRREVSARLRSGADLGTVLWEYAAPAGAFLGVGPDVDGDGLPELFEAMEGMSTFTYDSQGAVVAGVSQAEGGFTVPLTFLSGADRSALQTRTVSFEDQWTDAYAFPLLAGVFASDLRFAYQDVFVPAPGQVVEADATWRSTYAQLFAVAAGVFAERADQELAVRFFDAHGAAQGTLQLNDELRSPSFPALGDLDGDGVADAALSDVLVLTPVWSWDVPAQPLVRPTLAAYSGLDASVLWSVERDPILGQPLGPFSVGDLSGDGAQELSYVEVSFDPQSPIGAGFESLVISGRDGSTLGMADDLRILVEPFGDVTGDGVAEALLLMADDAFASLQLGVAGADMQPLWAASPGAYDWLLNVPHDGRYGDYSGDGAPDLLWMRDLEGGLYASYEFSDGEEVEVEFDFEPMSATIELQSGVDGRPAWTLEVEDAAGFFPVQDFTGEGDEDFLVVLVTGGDEGEVAKGNLRSANLTVELVAGESGKTVLRQTLRSPATQPVRGDAFPFVTAGGVGDLDGVPGSELAIVVEESDATRDWDDVPRQSWYLFSASQAAEPLTEVSNQQAAGERFADLQGSAEEARDSPAAPFALLAAAVLVAAVGRRMRRA